MEQWRRSGPSRLSPHVAKEVRLLDHLFNMQVLIALDLTFGAFGRRRDGRMRESAMMEQSQGIGATESRPGSDHFRPLSLMVAIIEQ